MAIAETRCRGNGPAPKYGHRITPLKGARIAPVKPPHDDSERPVLNPKTLTALGAEVALGLPATSLPQDHAAAAMAAAGIPCSAYKGRTLERILGLQPTGILESGADGGTADMILDDWAVMPPASVVLRHLRRSKTSPCSITPGSEEEIALFASIRRGWRFKGRLYSAYHAQIQRNRGNHQTGRGSLYQMQKAW